ncbi:hypothetical protein FB567DRAFT_618273 [Paraphoma chrysanthemicola]|uniref:Uncharacterized protein n=1 Tax=Paraphoma chrysanthemicola TaxID=798071 RepID=A0A8K0RE92_9PLEO|nr:hypothetical protein FB567DRAFT_618273 [Paraphoma chrysanthemicola]
MSMTVGPTDIPVAVLDLNGNPICGDGPVPVLRRSCSGHLLQPCNAVIKASEMTAPVAVAPDQIVTLRHATVHEVHVLQTARKNTTRVLKKRVRFSALCAKNSSSDGSKLTSPVLLEGNHVADEMDVHNCRNEGESLRCITQSILSHDCPDTVSSGEAACMIAPMQPICTSLSLVLSPSNLFVTCTSVELIRKEVLRGQHMLRYFQDEDEHREFQPECMVAPLRIKSKNQSDHPEIADKKLEDLSVYSYQNCSNNTSMVANFNRYSASASESQDSSNASSMVGDFHGYHNVPVGFDAEGEQLRTSEVYTQGIVISPCSGPSAPSLHDSAHIPSVVDRDTATLVGGPQDHETVPSISRSPLRVRNMVDMTAADIRTSTTIHDEVFDFVNFTLAPPPSNPPNQRDSTLSYAQHDYGTLAAILSNRASTPDTLLGSQASFRPRSKLSVSTIFDSDRAVHSLSDSRSIAALQRGIAWFEEHLPVRPGLISARVPRWSARVKAGFREGLGEVEEFLGGLL